MDRRGQVVIITTIIRMTVAVEVGIDAANPRRHRGVEAAVRGAVATVEVRLDAPAEVLPGEEEVSEEVPWIGDAIVTSIAADGSTGDVAADPEVDEVQAMGVVDSA